MSRLRALFDAVWPGMAAKLALADRLGYRWEEYSTPFVEESSRKAVAHVGVLEIPLRFGPRTILVGGIHAVCSHPRHRGRGFVRRAMERALRYSARYEGQQLYTEIPDFFEPFGFRRVPERRFVLQDLGRRTGLPARPLALEDAPLLGSLLSQRAAVSHWIEPAAGGWLFVLNEVLATGGFGRLRYCEDLDAVVACEVAGGVLRIYDVVARVLPRMPDLLGRLPPAERIELYFTPDQFGVKTEPVPGDWNGDLLMVRGPYPREGSEFMLSPLAHC